MADLDNITSQTSAYLSNADPATQQSDMEAIAQLLDDLDPAEISVVSQAAFGSLSYDDKRDLFPELVDRLSLKQVLGVVRGLPTPELQAELIKTAAGRLSVTQVMVMLAQAEIDVRHQLTGGAPQQARDREDLLNIVSQGLKRPITAPDPKGLQQPDAVVKAVADKISQVGGQQARVTVLPVFYAAEGQDGGIGRTALFKVEGTDGKPHLIDAGGRDYESVDDYRDNNSLPPEDVQLAMPLDGNYEPGPNGHVRLLIGDARREGVIEEFRRETHADLAVGGLALLGTGMILVAGSSIAVPAALLISAKAVLVGAGSYGAVAAADSVHDQLSHGSGLTFQVGLDTVNGLLSAAGMAQVASVGRLASAFTPGVRLALLTGNIAAEGAGLWNLASHAKSMEPGQVQEQALMLMLNATGIMLGVAGPRLLGQQGAPGRFAEAVENRRYPKPGMNDTLSWSPEEMSAMIRALEAGEPPPTLNTKSVATRGQDIKFIANEEIVGVDKPVEMGVIAGGNRQLELAYTADGRSVIQQQGVKACTAAASGMLIADNGGTLDLHAISHRKTSQMTAIAEDIEKAGLKPVTTTLTSLKDLQQALATNGSAAINLGTEIGGHALVVDAVNPKGGIVSIRDPWHGWAIDITLEAFMKRFNAQPVTAVQVAGGRRW